MASYDVIQKIQDLTSLSWNERTVTSGTGGTFLKARRETSRGSVYYKLSCYSSYDGIYGHESVNEVIASRLLDKLGIPHVPYRLIHALVNVNGVDHETWLCESHDYRKGGERKQPLETFYDLNSDQGESPLSFCISQGWKKCIFEMIAFDYLIMNRDRHGANIDIIFKDNTVELAPLYDHGLSLICTSYNDETRIMEVDPMADVRVNNYIGNRTSLDKNLNLIDETLFHSQLTDEDKTTLFHGLKKTLSPLHREKIWEIISQRWKKLVKLGIIDEG